MLHFEVELEVAYELSSRLHYLITLHYITLPDFVVFFYLVCNKKQPYIPSRKAVYVVEHVKKRSKHVEKKENIQRQKKKNCQHLTGVSITYARGHRLFNEIFSQCMATP